MGPDKKLRQRSALLAWLKQIAVLAWL